MEFMTGDSYYCGLIRGALRMANGIAVTCNSREHVLVLGAPFRLEGIWYRQVVARKLQSAHVSVSGGLRVVLMFLS